MELLEALRKGCINIVLLLILLSATVSLFYKVMPSKRLKPWRPVLFLEKENSPLRFKKKNICFSELSDNSKESDKFHPLKEASLPILGQQNFLD